MDAQPLAERQMARITLGAERDALPAVLAFLREVGGRLSVLPSRRAERLGRAVEAVCLNVIEHGFAAGQVASFDVVFLRRPGQSSWPWRIRAGPSTSRPRGGQELERRGAVAHGRRGDGVRFQSLGRRGNRVEIVKRLPYPDIETYIAGGQGAAVTPSSPDPSAAARHPAAHDARRRDRRGALHVCGLRLHAA